MSSKPTIKPSSQSPPKATSAQKKAPPVQILGDYRVQRKIGSGGMGTVFLAEHMELGRVVALKVLPVSKAENPTLVKRFKAEARAAANLKHKNIVTIYESGEAAGRFYIALEYIDGQDVLQILRKEGPFSIKRSVDVVKQTAAALQHAFEQNIVHRDIKPSNLLIDTDEVVKLTDMGLARSIDESAQTQITRDGTTVGTVDYMSPEQARDSKAADIRSDLYSLGCTWYQMLTLQVPFGEGSLTNKLNAHATQPPPDPRTLNDKIPVSIVAVIHRLLSKDPEDRYQTPQDLIDDLGKISLKQRNVSNDVLEGLATHSQTNKKKKKRRSGSATPPSAMPPKTKPANKSKQEEEEAGGFRIAPFKFAIMGVVCAGLLMGLYWVTTFIGSLAASPAAPPVNPGGTKTTPTPAVVKQVVPDNKVGGTNNNNTEMTAPPLTRDPTQKPKKDPSLDNKVPGLTPIGEKPKGNKTKEMKPKETTPKETKPKKPPKVKEGF